MHHCIMWSAHYLNRLVILQCMSADSCNLTFIYFHTFLRPYSQVD